MSKGQSSTMYVVIGVAVVAGLSVFLFLSQTGSTVETAETLLETSTAQQSRLVLSNVYHSTAVVPGEKNVALVDVLAYGCEYGEAGDDYQYSFSDSEPIVVRPEQELARVLDAHIGGKYYAYLECPREDRPEGRIEAGQQPPGAQENLQASSIPVPLPSGNSTEVYLYRWS